MNKTLSLLVVSLGTCLFRCFQIHNLPFRRLVFSAAMLFVAMTSVAQPHNYNGLGITSKLAINSIVSNHSTNGWVRSSFASTLSGGELLYNASTNQWSMNQRAYNDFALTMHDYHGLHFFTGWSFVGTLSHDAFWQQYMRMTLRMDGRVGIAVRNPQHLLSLPAGNNSISFGDNIFMNGQGPTGRISNNAFMSNNSWSLADASAHASTIEIRDTGVIEMYGTVQTVQLNWRRMFGVDVPNNKVHFPSGNVGIGTTDPAAKLSVDGDIRATQVKVMVDVNAAADYIFAEDYELQSLSSIHEYVQAHKYLPEVPAAQQMSEEGQDLGAMNLLLLKKTEELTLHLIEQEKKDTTIGHGAHIPEVRATLMWLFAHYG